MSTNLNEIRATMQLTKFSDYSLRVLMYLAEHQDSLCIVKDISDFHAISHHHLVKVVHHLAKLELIQTSRGKGGGICLAAKPEDLYLGALIEQLEPNMNLVECFQSETNTCRITNTCKLKGILHQAKTAFITSLNQYTLADISNYTKA